MDFPRKHGKFIDYNLQKDHNIFNLNRDYKKRDHSAKLTSERSIDSLQKV